MKIGVRMSYGFAVVIAVMLALGILSLWMMGKIHGTTLALENNNLPSAIALGAIDGMVGDFRIQQYKIAGEKDAAEYDEIEKVMQNLVLEIKKNEDVYTSTIAEDRERALNESFKKAWGEYLKINEAQILPLAKALKNEETYKAVVGAKPLFDKLMEALAEAVALNRHNAIEASHAAERMFGRSIVLTVLLIAFAVIISITITVVLTRSMTVPLDTLVGASSRIAKGDLTSEISLKSSDEIGALAESFRTMMKSLHGILSKAKDATNQITSASNEILAASQQQAASAREQSSAVNETTSAAAELSKSSEQIGDNIKQVASATSHALTGMAKIKEAINKTSEKITSLSEKSQQIGKITELINDVADQTNLLAVNAAIEAARAGEHGRGFTVVADEIRKLSDSTAKSTKDITALVEIIQHEMSHAIMAMEQSIVNVNEESRLSQESADSAREITMGATQQVSGSKQIADAMSNVNEAMKQISAGAQQATTAAKQLTALAGELQEATARFKL